jgi:exosome complex RNA-binding protein Rrp4
MTSQRRRQLKLTSVAVAVAAIDERRRQRQEVNNQRFRVIEESEVIFTSFFSRIRIVVSRNSRIFAAQNSRILVAQNFRIFVQNSRISAQNLDIFAQNEVSKNAIFLLLFEIKKMKLEKKNLMMMKKTFVIIFKLLSRSHCELIKKSCEQASFLMLH